MISTRTLSILAFIALVSLSATTPAAAQDDYVGPTPPRLSLIDGEVSHWPVGGDDWQAARLNLPLAPGDFLATGGTGRLELEIGTSSFLRVAPYSEIGVERLDLDRLGLRVGRGRITLDIRRNDAGSTIEVETAHGRLAVTAPGLYDVRVDDDRAWFTAYDGSGATVRTPSGSTILSTGFELVAGPGFAQPARYDAPVEDDWIRWSRERSERILAAQSRAWLGDGVYGARDLDDHGRWHDEPEYGRLWVPTGVGPNWAPYTAGQWIWSTSYGWTWVDAEPWGWAPFHYGRWVRWQSRWAWAPGPAYVRPVYAPALVAFLAPPVGVVYSADPIVSWVALGWGEPVVPWWGPTWYRGRPCWTGWGGPTIINEIHVHRHDWWHRHRHRDIRRYRHQDYPDAVAVVHRRDFDDPRGKRLRLDPERKQRFRPGHDTLPAPARPQRWAEDRVRSRPSRPAPGHRDRRPDVARSDDRGGREMQRPGAPRDRDRAESMRPPRQDGERRMAAPQRPEPREVRQRPQPRQARDERAVPARPQSWAGERMRGTVPYVPPNVRNERPVARTSRPAPHVERERPQRRAAEGHLRSQVERAPQAASGRTAQAPRRVDSQPRRDPQPRQRSAPAARPSREHVPQQVRPDRSGGGSRVGRPPASAQRPTSRERTDRSRPERAGDVGGRPARIRGE